MEQITTTTKNEHKENVTAKPKTEKVARAKKVISEVSAHARFIRMSPRKIRLIIDQVRGQEAVAAVHALQFMNRAAVRPVAKLLNSAIANAENNFQIDKKDLFIKKIIANEGPILKRFQPRAHGSSARIRKRTSHISVVLGVRPGATKKAVTTDKAGKKDEAVKVLSPEEVKKSGPKSGGKPGAGTTTEQGKETKGFLKGVFQRKTG